jgi:hypothetical protein
MDMEDSLVFGTARDSSDWHSELLVQIFFRLAGPRVGYGETAITRGDNFKIRAISIAFWISNLSLGAVVCGIGIFGGVDHVEVFEAGAIVHGLPCFGTASFVSAVVHDGHARMNGIDDGARAGLVEAVVSDQI